MSSIMTMVDQHAEEAGFLVILRDYAVRAPHYDQDDLSHLDNRIDAHLDGLRVAGQMGLDILFEQLASHTIGDVFCAAVLAFESSNTAVLSTQIGRAHV